jgi:hypothetical protein
VKPVVLLLVVTGLCLSAQVAEAQRSGSLQATARVVDTRQSLNGLLSAYTVAALLAQGQGSAPVESAVAHVSVDRRPHEEADRPRTASITINYLRN